MHTQVHLLPHVLGTLHMHTCIQVLLLPHLLGGLHTGAALVLAAKGKGGLISFTGGPIMYYHFPLTMCRDCGYSSTTRNHVSLKRADRSSPSTVPNHIHSRALNIVPHTSRFTLCISHISRARETRETGLLKCTTPSSTHTALTILRYSLIIIPLITYHVEVYETATAHTGGSRVDVE